ncbi:MAG: hypothetical protein K2F73_04355, partial [Ruminococcus sp.]|nr:hypothetical protein [Ruminococcus sp.]
MKKIFRNLAVTLTAVICSAVGMTGISVSADTTENSANYLSGDVNSDGKFTIADVLIFQKWITGSDVTLNNWQAVDFNQDGVLDVFDLCMMKNELRSYNSIYKDERGYPVSNPDVIDEFTPCTATDEDFFDTGGIRVVIKHQYSVSDRVWTVDDFKGIDNIKSFCQSDNYNPTSSVVPPYRQIIEIGLEECSVENVLKMVHDIEALNLPEVMEVEVRKYGTGLLPMTPEEYEEYLNSINIIRTPEELEEYLNSTREENKSENQSEECEEVIEDIEKEQDSNLEESNDSDGISKSYSLNQLSEISEFAIITTDNGDFSIELTAPDGTVYENYADGEFVTGFIGELPDGSQIYGLGKRGIRVVNPVISVDGVYWSFKVVSHLPYR